jgi:hypothetical protein
MWMTPKRLSAALLSWALEVAVQFPTSPGCYVDILNLVCTQANASSTLTPIHYPFYSFLFYLVSCFIMLQQNSQRRPQLQILAVQNRK